MTQLSILDVINQDVCERSSQTARILEHLKSGRSITPLQALNDFGCFRLGARCWDLRHGKFDGKEYEIKREMVKTKSGKSVAQYSLEA